MRLSLIITTYNWPQALELVLRSAIRQTRLPDEIIVADDGSSADTGALIKQIAATSAVPIRHQWQEDLGFRAARIRNAAIAAARGDYIILLDQDMVLEPHFCADHLAAARAGFFVQGSRVLVTARATSQALATKSLDFGLFQAGLENRKNMLRAAWLSVLLARPTTRLAGIRTCNFAFWRQDGLAINGFNEDFIGWGREDSEFAARLLNSGVRRLNLRFRAVAFHLHHNLACRQALAENDLLLEQTVSQRLRHCDNGIDKHLSAQPQGEIS